MSNLNLFDKRGKFTAPSPDVLDKLTPEVRAAVETVGAAAAALDAATLAVVEAEQKLKTVRAEIELAEKTLPPWSRLDDVRAFQRESNKRRAGI